MNRFSFLGVFACSASLVCWVSPYEASAALYSGNGNASFGGAVGNGSLSLVDNGTSVSGTFTRGTSGNFNDCLILYLDTGASGFTTTANFTDTGDPLRRAISGVDGGNRSTANFASGFNARYAIALDANGNNGSFGGLWQLVQNGSHSYVDSVSLSPLNNTSSSSYTFSFDWSDIGLSGGSGTVLKFESTYLSDSAFRSGESFASISGTPGWNTFTFSDFDTLTAVPEPAHYGLICAAGLIGAAAAHRRRAAAKASRA